MIVDILAGYLGSGKTTYINQLLESSGLQSSQSMSQRLAILVNDFGDINIDKQLIKARQGKMIDIAGGCICCAYGSDLVEGLQAIDARAGDFDRLLIECSGVALPKPVRDTVNLCMPNAQIYAYTMIHLGRIREQLDDPYIGGTVELQLRQADGWLGSHADLLGDEEAAQCMVELCERFPRDSRQRSALTQKLSAQTGIRSQFIPKAQQRWRSFTISQSEVSTLAKLESRIKDWVSSGKDPARDARYNSRVERIKGYLQFAADEVHWIEWVNGSFIARPYSGQKEVDQLGLVVIEVMLPESWL